MMCTQKYVVYVTIAFKAVVDNIRFYNSLCKVKLLYKIKIQGLF